MATNSEDTAAPIGRDDAIIRFELPKPAMGVGAVSALLSPVGKFLIYIRQLP